MVRFKHRGELSQQLVATVRALMIGLKRRPFDHPAQLAFIECARPDLFRPALEHPVRMRHQPAVQRVVGIAPIESCAEEGRCQIPPRLCLCPRRGGVVAAIPARGQHRFRDEKVKFQPASMYMRANHDGWSRRGRNPGEYALQKHLDRTCDKPSGFAARVEFQRVDFVRGEAEGHGRKAVLMGLPGNHGQGRAWRSNQRFRRGRAQEEIFATEFQRARFRKKVSRKAHRKRVVRSRLVPLHHHFGVTRLLAVMIAASCASMRWSAAIMLRAVASFRAANPSPRRSTSAQRVKIP